MAQGNDPNWIENAGLNEGAFSKKAKKAGISVAELASKDLGPKSKVTAATKKQAVLAQTLKKLGKKKCAQ